MGMYVYGIMDFDNLSYIFALIMYVCIPILTSSDFGASVITVDKVGAPSVNTMTRNKRSLAVNLKEPRGTRIVSSLAKKVSGFA